MQPGPRNLITDVDGLLVGNSCDVGIKTGVTVVTGTAPFTASVSVMGGAPGTRDTELLSPNKSVPAVDALVLSGGSAFGLDACSGVVQALRDAGRGFAVGPARVPLVPGAILFDLLNGGNKDWVANPYPTLGAQAYEARSDDFDLGSVGAGTGATTATIKGGLGSASLVLTDGTTVGALVAANPVGCVTTPGEAHFWGAAFEMNGEFGGLGPDPRSGLGADMTRIKGAAREGANTTIAVVATDATLSKAECERVAIMAQDGIGRAIVPAHSPMDGDLVFAAATAKRGPSDVVQIGHAAALCLTRAIGRAIYEASPADGDLLPCFKQR